MNKSKIPTILGILILITGVAVGVFILQQQQTFKLGASPEASPKNIEITNITSESFTVSWTTDKETIGYLKWGKKKPNENNSYQAEKTAKNIHQISLHNLEPNTNYSFIINSDGKDHDNNNIPWQVKTGPPLPPPQKTNIISGKVILPTGQPASNKLVYLNAAGISPLSTLTSSNGDWVIAISNARSNSLNSYANIDENTLLEILIQGGPSGIASAQIYLKAANPTPPITLGKIHDFRSETGSHQEEIPASQINLPEETEKDIKSKFVVPAVEKEEETSSVTLDSIEDGEIIFTNDPEFFGKGPSGNSIKITVESDLISDELTIPSSGAWKWSPPKELEPGEHKITISWVDKTGILRTLTRTFIVQAAENEPAFESTPSGNEPSPTPTIKPTQTPKPTATATPKVTTSPTSTPRVSIPSTDSATPIAGNPIPTIIMLLFGTVFLFLGIFLAV